MYDRVLGKNMELIDSKDDTGNQVSPVLPEHIKNCLLYTSDAADE